MEYTARYITDDIKLSCYEDKFFKSDIMFDQHMIVWFISGETKVIQADATYFFKKGDIFLIPRHQLATVINYPKDGQPHTTVVMHLTSAKLQDYYSRLDGLYKNGSQTQKIRSYRDHPLLASCLSSLMPYFEMRNIPEEIASLKITEAISILRTIDPGVDNVLANFQEPGKIDLCSYMEKNFMFNLPLEQFAYLTGRSLTTFKRDFQRSYNMTPRRWLIRKRLELAHYRLSRGNGKPVHVCYEVGFENLSHFSFIFKNQYGYPPTSLAHESKSQGS